MALAFSCCNCYPHAIWKILLSFLCESRYSLTTTSGSRRMATPPHRRMGRCRSYHPATECLESWWLPSVAVPGLAVTVLDRPDHGPEEIGAPNTPPLVLSVSNGEAPAPILMNADRPLTSTPPSLSDVSLHPASASGSGSGFSVPSDQFHGHEEAVLVSGPGSQWVQPPAPLIVITADSGAAGGRTVVVVPAPPPILVVHVSFALPPGGDTYGAELNSSAAASETSTPPWMSPPSGLRLASRVEAPGGDGAPSAAETSAPRRSPARPRPSCPAGWRRFWTTFSARPCLRPTRPGWMHPQRTRRPPIRICLRAWSVPPRWPRASITR